MTTTAHEDQFTAGTQTIQPVLQPYSTEAILRRNIADAKKEMQRQAERAESYADAMRSLASYVGAGGYNADTVDAGVFEEKIRWGIGELMARTEKAEAELAKLAQQKPSLWISSMGAVRPRPNTKWPSHCASCGLQMRRRRLIPKRCINGRLTFGLKADATTHARGKSLARHADTADARNQRQTQLGAQNERNPDR